MKRISSLIIGTGLTLIAFTTFADDTATTTPASTSLTANWSCTTNASSSSVAADKAADDQMAQSTKSAADAFAFATQNCRDCTKITCESKE